MEKRLVHVPSTLARAHTKQSRFPVRHPLSSVTIILWLWKECNIHHLISGSHHAWPGLASRGAKQSRNLVRATVLSTSAHQSRLEIRIYALNMLWTNHLFFSVPKVLNAINPLTSHSKWPSPCVTGFWILLSHYKGSWHLTISVTRLRRPWSWHGIQSVFFFFFLLNSSWAMSALKQVIALDHAP